MPTQEQLNLYADVLIQVGLNIQPGQAAQIYSPLETDSFARLLLTRLYDAGAGDVEMEHGDPLSRRIRLEKAPEASLTHVPKWRVLKEQEQIDRNTAFLYIDAEDPDLLVGVDTQRIGMASKAWGEAFQETSKAFMADRITWLVCAIPSVNWACKMFPDARPEEAMDLLWDAIFTVMRMKEPDPVAAWKAHFANLERRAAFMNKKRFHQLHYKAPGTNLSIAFSPKNLWVAATSTNDQGTLFCANLPTEEIFTMPKRDGVNGTLRSTMPLVHGGVVIKGIELTFENGRVTDYRSETGYDTLKELIEMDEGSHYLGEVALVPVDSPIAQLNRLFYSTLFDENASCHLAVGKAYANCLDGGREMSDEELLRNGANDSITHVDFMIGSAELDIDGETHNGELVPLFRKGRWTI